VAKQKGNISAPDRHDQIRRELEKNPYILDHELAEVLSVSIHTVRADRKALGIPDIRKRFREWSDARTARSKTITDKEIVGELLEVELDLAGISLLETADEMGFSNSRIIRGHVLFAQANSLAAAIVNSEHALTAQAQVQFSAAAYVGEKILGKARILSSNHWKKEVEVILKTPTAVVFKGHFLVYSLNERIAIRLGLVRSSTKE
jgi:acyl-coenzyme A thioesterase PaaI-like protein